MGLTLTKGSCGVVLHGSLNPWREGLADSPQALVDIVCAGGWQTTAHRPNLDHPLILYSPQAKNGFYIS